MHGTCQFFLWLRPVRHRGRQPGHERPPQCSTPPLPSCHRHVQRTSDTAASTTNRPKPPEEPRKLDVTHRVHQPPPATTTPRRPLLRYGRLPLDILKIGKLETAPKTTGSWPRASTTPRLPLLRYQELVRRRNHTARSPENCPQ